MANRLWIIQPSFCRSKTEQTVVHLCRRQRVLPVLPYEVALTPLDWNARLVDGTVQKTAGNSDFGAY